MTNAMIHQLINMYQDELESEDNLFQTNIDNVQCSIYFLFVTLVVESIFLDKVEDEIKEMR